MKELSRRKDNWQNMKNYWKKKTVNKREKFLLDLETKTHNLLRMRDNLIGLSKYRDKRKKRNNRKNGKREKKQELTCSIKSTMTEKRRWENIKRPRMNSWNKKRRIKEKSKKESGSINLSKKVVVKGNMKDQNLSKRNSFNRSPKSRKRDVLYF